MVVVLEVVPAVEMVAVLGVLVAALEDLVLPQAHLKLRAALQPSLLPRLVLEVPRLLPSWSAPP
ncbi:hypothetical protein M378DRAFT_168387 [Amanita muscaria Koide BX008]|uniref:Uncharacterized protein n=1 Tax=Amanita muscaria (strain Koide BX008) TaxID=946122 RepID=A0A0C2WFP2_AMAMK|nr:hypothetical protein M378DRAFT_168387 [Amanita muscaria Koide BX008]